MYSAFSTAGSALIDYPQIAKDWYQPAEDKIIARAENQHKLAKGKAKNVILFVGDGMGVSTITAARIFAGQQRGMTGEEYELSFDKFPYTGMARTYNTNMQTPDSAGTMTALITGVKTKGGVLSINDNVIRQDCATEAGNELLSAIEIAEIAGKATGIVTTTRITHATPAATYSSSVERNWESDSDMPAEAIALGCEDIASQLIHFTPRLKKYLHAQAYAEQLKSKALASINGPDIVLGGGLRAFLPEGQHQLGDWQVKGKRKDNRNLLNEWQQANPEGSLVHDAKALKAAIQQKKPKVLGLFSASHMAYDADRRAIAEQGDGHAGKEPSLAEMTVAAIEHLKRDKHGFVLMVEAGRIDHAHHANNAFNALSDTVALSDAVKAALEHTNAKETLIVVTADHSHVFTMAGYPQRGNPILGKVISPDVHGKKQSDYALDADGKPYTTLGYMNGRGYADLKGSTDADARYNEAINAGRKNLTEIDTQHPGYHQESLVPLDAETHGGEDVAIFARGPGAYLFSGSHEQNVIFHAINYAGQLVAAAEKKLF